MLKRARTTKRKERNYFECLWSERRVQTSIFVFLPRTTNVTADIYKKNTKCVLCLVTNVSEISKVEREPRRASYFYRLHATPLRFTPNIPSDSQTLVDTFHEYIFQKFIVSIIYIIYVLNNIM